MPSRAGPKSVAGARGAPRPASVPERLFPAPGATPKIARMEAGPEFLDRREWAALCLSCLPPLARLLPQEPSEASGPEQERPYLHAAEGAARWLRRAEPSTDPTLYAGACGPLLFELELAAALAGEGTGTAAVGAAPPERLLEQALSLARGAAQAQAEGLYTGRAGIAFTLGTAARALRSDELRLAAQRLLAAPIERCLRGESPPPWQESWDLIAGAAGLGFTWLWAAEELELDGALDAARAAGTALLEAGDREQDRISWPPARGGTRRYPNFSHGTAGITAFLAALHARTREERFLAGARAGGRHLRALAHPTGEHGCAIHHSTPGNESLDYAGWCHGPAGTARTFTRLHTIDPEGGWDADERRFAAGLRELGVPARSPGFWNNVSRCCGHAGVIEFCLARHARSGAEEDLRFAEEVATDLLRLGAEEEGGRSWVQAEHRVRPDLLRAQTGLMQGASGIGLALLHLDGARSARAPRVLLPDEWNES